MHEEGSIVERRIDALQCGKKEMACRVAELNELTVIRGELEHRLFDLNANIKQLKAKQYELHQQNVNVQCEILQGKKTLDQWDEEIELGKAVSREIQMDLAQQKDNILQLQREKEKMLIRKQELQSKIEERMAQIVTTKKNFDQVQENIESLRKVQQSRQEVIEKIRQSHQYYLAKAEQIHRNKQNLQKLRIQQEKGGQDLKKAIQQGEKQLQTIISRKADNQREIINQVDKIDSQKLRQKVLLEKLQMMKERLAALHQQQQYGHHLLQMKQKTARQAQQKRNTRRSAWLSMRMKIGVELEYCRHYCQQLEHTR